MLKKHASKNFEKAYVFKNMKKHATKNVLKKAYASKTCQKPCI